MIAAFKKNLTTEIKVAQFSGYVSEHSGYHHGEASLNGAIVGMAQNFVGSNNINLLVPSGQFGTRLQGGKDSASERYIFTYLNKITRSIFPEMDDHVLKYLDDDGMLVEPLFYAPIIPMILVNGAKGIGTGFSTDIMCYNPLTIIEYLKSKLSDLPATSFEFVPYYDGFQGQIEKISEGKFLVKGKYEKLGVDKVRVTELPVGFWTEDFKELLESLTEATDKTGKKIVPIVKDYDDMSKDTNVDFTITLQKGKLDEMLSSKADHGVSQLEKTLKLYTTCSSTNMHLFDANDKLKKYANVPEIIDDYFETRLELYQKRKNYMIATLSSELVILSNKARYIKENLDGTIDLRKKKKEEVNLMLKTKKYHVINGDEDYKYLTKMPMDSVTSENVDKLNKEHDTKQKELAKIQATTIQEMWRTELDLVKDAYVGYKEERERSMSGLAVKKASVVKVKKQVLAIEK
jgi:DNA topoisomerase II